MAAFATVTQVAGAWISRGDDINNEVARQKAICDEIGNTNDQLLKMQGLINDIVKNKEVTDDNDTLISSLSDTLKASQNNITDLQKQYQQKLLVIIVSNIVLVAFLSIIIVSKRS